MAISAKPAVYMEACSFIDMAKQKIGSALTTDRERDVASCRLLLKAGQEGHITVYTSTLTIAECQHAGDGTAPRAVQELFHRLLMSGQFVVLVQLTPFVAADARDLRWKHGINLKGADAVHLASALDRKCVEFITSDDGLKRPKVAAAVSPVALMGLRLIRGSDTLLIPASYRQSTLFGSQTGPTTGASP